MGLFVQAFLFKRELMGLAYHAYAHIEEMGESAVEALPLGIRDEVIMMASSLPRAISHVEDPVDPSVSATDATPGHGGRARAR